MKSKEGQCHCWIVDQEVNMINLTHAHHTCYIYYMYIYILYVYIYVNIYIYIYIYVYHIFHINRYNYIYNICISIIIQSFISHIHVIDPIDATFRANSVRCTKAARLGRSKWSAPRATKKPPTWRWIHGSKGGFKGKSENPMELQWNYMELPETNSAKSIHGDPPHFSAFLRPGINTHWLESWWTSKFVAKLMCIHPIPQIRHVWSWESLGHPNLKETHPFRATVKAAGASKAPK